MSKGFFWGNSERRNDKNRTKDSESRRTSESKEQFSQSDTERTGNRCSEQDKKHISTMITLNVRGLILKKDKSKVKQLEAMAIEYNAAVIVLTETWFDESILSGEVAINGYSLYRTDRNGRNRGGTCIYIKSNAVCQAYNCC